MRQHSAYEAYVANTANESRDSADSAAVGAASGKEKQVNKTTPSAGPSRQRYTNNGLRDIERAASGHMEEQDISRHGDMPGGNSGKYKRNDPQFLNQLCKEFKRNLSQDQVKVHFAGNSEECEHSNEKRRGMERHL